MYVFNGYQQYVVILKRRNLITKQFHTIEFDVPRMKNNVNPSISPFPCTTVKDVC